MSNKEDITCYLSAEDGNCNKTCKVVNQREQIFIVEDDLLLQKTLKATFASANVKTMDNGLDLLDMVKEQIPSVIILDYNIPGINGLSVCEKLKDNPLTADIPVVFMTADSDAELRYKAFESGCEDFIQKPLIVKEVRTRINRILQNNKLINQMSCRNDCLKIKLTEQQLELSSSQLATIRALVKMSESRDDDTGKHVERVQHYCRDMAEKYLLQGGHESVQDNFTDLIFHASCLHDIGKVSIPDGILKKEGPLTDGEFGIMKTHSEMGYKALLDVHLSYPQNKIVKMGMTIAQLHHEKWDGSGYPNGLSEEAIPVGARIMALADVYDALRSKRCYKEPFTHEKSVAIINEGRGKHFDPVLCDIFLSDSKSWDTIFKTNSGG